MLSFNNNIIIKQKSIFISSLKLLIKDLFFKNDDEKK